MAPKKKAPEIWAQTVVRGRVLQVSLGTGGERLLSVHHEDKHYLRPTPWTLTQKGTYEYPEPLPALEVGDEVVLHTAIEHPCRLFVEGVEIISKTNGAVAHGS